MSIVFLKLQGFIYHTAPLLVMSQTNTYYFSLKTCVVLIIKYLPQRGFFQLVQMLPLFKLYDHMTVGGNISDRII